MAKRKGGGSNRPNVRGSTDFDALVAVLSEMMDAKLDEVRPRLGTVRGGGSGNEIRIQMDGESDGDGRKRAHGGGKKNDGDTVLMFPTGGGNYVALGPVMTEGRANREQIGADEIERDAIDSRHIRRNALTRDHIPNGLIGQSQIAQGAVNRSEIHDSVFTNLARQGDVTRVDKRIDGLGSRLEALQKKVQGQGGGN